MAAEEYDATALRIAIEGGGCSGFQYASASIRPPGRRRDRRDARRYDRVDPFSLPYLKGADIDYVEGLNAPASIFRT